MHPQLSLNTPSQATNMLRMAYATATSANCQSIILSSSLSIDRLILLLFKMMLFILKGILLSLSLLFSGQILEFKCEWGGGNYHRSERKGHPQTLWEVARSSFLWRSAFSQVHLESEYDTFYLWECTESPFMIYAFLLQCLMQWMLFVCNVGAMPVDHEQYYGFTKFAIELNELDPSLKLLLPLTDTRLRVDQR